MASSMPSRLASLLPSKEKERYESRRIRQSSSMSSSTASKSIPIHIANQHDIQDEHEIREQEWIAEEKDLIMFHRIVNGMLRSSSSSIASATFQCECDKRIANVMRTHYNKKTDATSTKDSDMLFYDDEDETEYAYNESCGDLSNNPSNDNANDRPPDAIFIMDM